jgi:sugar-specific transcriptional regulator TrmB
MDLEEVLKEIGFSDYKAKVYKTLLYLGIATSAAVAKESGVPQTKVHGILNELAKDGFAIIIPGRPTRFKAIPPSSAIVPIIEERIKKASELKTIVEKAEENLAAKEFPKREILVFQGWNIIRKIHKEDILNSEKEILLFLRFGKPDSEIIQAIEKNVKKGVKVKVLGPYRKERETTMFLYKNIGCEVRVLKTISFPLVTFGVYDEKTLRLRFYTFSQQEEGLIIKIEDEETAKLMKEVFNELWKKAEPIN